MPQVSLLEAVELTVINWYTQLTTGERMPIAYVSAPGIGKSSVIYNELPKQLAKFLNDDVDRSNNANDVLIREGKQPIEFGQWTPKHFYLNPLMCPTQEGVIAQGLPVPIRTQAEGEETRAHTVLAPSRISRPVTDAPFVLTFLDEFDKAQPDFKMAMSEFINSGFIGDTQLPLSNYAALAMNRSQDKSGTTNMPMHIQNRIDEVHVKVNREDWIAWALANTNIPATAIGLLQFKPDIMVDAVPKSAEPYCTYRSYTKAMQGLAVSDAINPNQPHHLRRARLVAAIGQAATTEFFAYEKFEAQCTPYEDIMADPENAPVPTELGVQWAQNMCLWNNVTDKDSPKVFKYMLRMPKQFWATLLEHKLMSCPSLFADSDYIQWVSKDENLTFLSRVAAYR
jgi:hypothetical protein